MESRDIVDFWFVECAPLQWFMKDETFDAQIRERFGDVYERVARGETADWRATPEGRLAEIIVLDQFARNMFRGTPKAFAADPIALRLAREAVEKGEDAKLPRVQRRFLYMPYMHSEDRATHRKALWLFAKLLDWNTLRYEWKHKRIIDRFGRYPHRNAILGRPSTPEEDAFVRSNPGF